MQQTLQPILGHRPVLEQPLSMGHQCTQLADWRWWHPDGRNEIGSQELRQRQRIAFVRLDERGRAQLDLGRVGDHHAADEWDELVVKGPGINRRLQHHLIRRQEVATTPFGELCEADPAWRQDHCLGGIDRANDDIRLMDIQGDKTSRSIGHSTLLKGKQRLTSRRQSGACRCGLNVCCMHRYELDPMSQLM